MNEDEIPGRDLITDGRFPPDWKEHWTHFNGKGIARPYTDPDYGYYLLMNGEAAVSQTFKAAPFTPAQLEKARYRLSFQYENHGDGSNAKVVIKTSNGSEDTINLSGKIFDKPMADWNRYEPYTFTTVTSTDKDITIELHGSNLTGVSGLRITDLNIQLHLDSLKLSKIQVDNRVYELQN